MEAPVRTPGAASASRPRVLLVDDDPMQRQLLHTLLEPDGYDLATAADGGEAMRAVAEELPDLILLDVRMPGLDGFGVIERLKQDDWTSAVPVIMLTAAEDHGDRLHALQLGAEDLLRKPVDRAELRARVRSLLQGRQHRLEREQAEAVLLVVARMVEARDPWMQGHSDRVARLVLGLGQALGVEARGLRTLALGARLHDIGLVALPEAILLKAGPLAAAEKAAIRTHPAVGEGMLRPLETLDAVRPLVRQHHERMDGSGYPDGLGGVELSLPVRVLAVAEVFDALTVQRPYRRARPAAEAAALLRREAEHGFWDAAVVAALEERISHPEPAPCETDLLSLAPALARWGGGH